jgi:hypothetical protein
MVQALAYLRTDGGGPFDRSIARDSQPDEDNDASHRAGSLLWQAPDPLRRRLGPRLG